MSRNMVQVVGLFSSSVTHQKSFSKRGAKLQLQNKPLCHSKSFFVLLSKQTQRSSSGFCSFPRTDCLMGLFPAECRQQAQPSVWEQR